MNISRKEFLSRGLAAFGRDILSATRGEEPAKGGLCEGAGSGALLVDNARCLAGRSGCFSCIDRCPQEAISIDAGVGITVDSALCDGCGECVQVCPIEPKPIRLKNQEAVISTGEKGD